MAPRIHFAVPVVTALLVFAVAVSGQESAPVSYSVATPRPINPAEGTTTPSAQAAQRQNPYLGSVPSPSVAGNIGLSLKDAIARGLRYNLGLVESRQGSADTRADRLRALSALLPQLSAQGRQGYEDLSFKEIGLKLPPIPGLPALPATSGGFGYQDVRISITQRVYDAELRNQYRARKAEEQASALSMQDSRDVAVFATAVAYEQVVASTARLETAKAQLASARELERQTSDKVLSEVSPEIESLRAQVESQSAEQRLTNTANQLEKNKLALARVIGFSIDQQFTVTDPLAHHAFGETTMVSATEEALHSRADLRSAEASVRSAESALRAQKSQKLPVVSLIADYGGAGANLGNFNQVYSLGASVSVPIYTGGRITADIDRAQSELVRREAELQDLKGRVAYDVRVAWLDLSASESGVGVSERNKVLASRALTQSRDRYNNGVTNLLEVVQAQEAVTAADENYIESLFSYNVSLISLARAMGGAETHLSQMTGAN